MKTVEGSQDVDLFREIMVLPMRVSSRKDCEKLRDLFLENWTVVDSLESRTPLSKTFPPQPIRNEFANENLEEYSSRQAYGEAAYFHPFVQKFLYDWQPDTDKKETVKVASMQHYRRTDFDRISVLMDYGYGGGPTKISNAKLFQIELAVERIDLHIAPQPGVIFLVVEVAATPDSKLLRFDENDVPLKGDHKLCLAEVLALLDGLRRTYPPFFVEFNKKIPKYDATLFPKAVALIRGGAESPDLTSQQSEAGHSINYIKTLNEGGLQPTAPWWADALWPLAPEGLDGTTSKQVAVNLRYIVDERMPSMAFISVPSIKNVSRSDQIRLCFADHGGEGLPYSADFLENFEAEHCYDRFFDLRRKFMTVRYMFSSYSFVALCETGVKWPLGSKDWSFALDVLQEHFRRHYFKMFLIAQIHRASLLSFSHWLSQALEPQNSAGQFEYRRKISDIRQSFVAFTHNYWFSNVSSQEQARDLFGKMQKHFGNEELYDEVKTEAEQAREELAEIAVERQADAALVFNAFIGVATLVGVPLAIFGVLPTLSPKIEIPRDMFWLNMGLVLLLAGFMTGFVTFTQSNHLRLGRQFKEMSHTAVVAYFVALICIVASFVFFWLGYN